MAKITQEGAKLTIMPILPVLCICENLEWPKKRNLIESFMLEYNVTTLAIPILCVRQKPYISSFNPRLILLFWISGHVCPGFQSQVGSLHLGTDSSDSPLMKYLLASWHPGWRLSHFNPYICEQVLVELETRLNIPLPQVTR